MTALSSEAVQRDRSHVSIADYLKQIFGRSSWNGAGGDFVSRYLDLLSAVGGDTRQRPLLEMRRRRAFATWPTKTRPRRSRK